MAPLRLAPNAVLAAVVTLAAHVQAQVCAPPTVPPGGFATLVDLFVPVTYSDTYQTVGSMIKPDVTPPTCGWPLVVFVHPLGQNRGNDLAFQTTVASQGFVVWDYDVRGHGAAANIPGNQTLPHVGSTLWGPIERVDLAEQIQFVLNEPGYAGLVDGQRIAVVGSSQGGAHAWFAAALSGQTIDAPDRPTTLFPTIACVVASDYAADPVEDWVRGGTLFGSWFIEALSGSYTGVPFDQTFVQTCRNAFLAQDPQGLATTLTNDGRSLAALLATTGTKVLYSHAYHDSIDSPLSSLRVLATMAAPHRAILSTIGHNAPLNHAEREFRDSLTIRWLRRWLWDEPNEVELESPFVLAELPLERVVRDDPTTAWSRHHGDDPLQPVSAPRYYLYGDLHLDEVEPTTAQPPVTIAQVIDPTVTNFTPADYLNDPTVRDFQYVQSVCPVSEMIYTLIVPSEVQIAAPPRLHLRVVPDHAEWQLAALLTVEPPGPGAEGVMLTSQGIGSLNSTVGVAEEHDLVLPPIAARIPAGSTIRLRVRTMWLREDPMPHSLEVAPLFHDFAVEIQHGDSTNGSWLDLPLEPVRPKLATTSTWLDVVAPTPVTLFLRGGVARDGYPYFATVGLSGQRPVTPYLGEDLPIDLDWLVLTSAGSAPTAFFSGFLGFLDGNGDATATLDLTSIAPLPSALVGFHLTATAFVWDGPWAPTGAAANPCDIAMR